MILRAIDPPASAASGYVPAWPVIERLQKRSCDRCFMITQPSHAALAGEIAARMAMPQSFKLDGEIVRAIALHDAGWGAADAQAVIGSRAARPVPPRSFLAMEASEVLEAWTQSIQVAQSVGPAGGFIVSRHFHRIAERRIAAGEDSAGDRKKIDQFLAHEAQRQKRLSAKQPRGAQELESLTDFLQLCDLLSLYICCGAAESVEFPDFRGVGLRLRRRSQGYEIDPPVLGASFEFAVAALRYPAAKEKSGVEIAIAFV